MTQPCGTIVMTGTCQIQRDDMRWLAILLLDSWTNNLSTGIYLWGCFENCENMSF